MTFIIFVCIVVALAAFGIIKEKYYPYVLYSISLALLLQVTLALTGLVGTDIHLEYYFATTKWSPSFPHSYNSALGDVLLVPFLAHLIPALWVFKIMFPAMFACVPVILYFVFKHWVSAKLAFLSAFLFISVPTYFTELTGIPKQQLAELFLALMFLLFVIDFKLKYKLPAVIVLCALVVVSHYSLGMILMFLLVIAFATKACLEERERFPTWALGLTTLVVVVGGIFYYGRIAGGTPLSCVLNLVPVKPIEVGPVQVGPVQVGPVVVGPVISMTTSYPTLMKMALGLDFLKVGVLGKLFRLLQWFTLILLAVGLVRMRKSYWTFASGCVAILALCVLVPSFSAILNTTRFYHLSLFALAPALVVGGVKLLNYKVLTALLLVYFLFTSGFVFEAAKIPNVSDLTIPYNVALTHDRIDLGTTTENDEGVRDWIVKNDVKPIYADFYGFLFLQEKLGTSSSLKMLTTDFDVDGYVFLRERSVEDGNLIYWKDIGLRECGSIENGKTVYQVGDSKVIWASTK